MAVWDAMSVRRFRVLLQGLSPHSMWRLTPPVGRRPPRRGEKPARELTGKQAAEHFASMYQTPEQKAAAAAARRKPTARR